VVPPGGDTLITANKGESVTAEMDSAFVYLCQDDCSDDYPQVSDVTLMIVGEGSAGPPPGVWTLAFDPIHIEDRRGRARGVAGVRPRPRPRSRPGPATRRQAARDCSGP